MKKIFTLIAFLVTATITLAQTISESAALEKAAHFFNNKTSGAKGTLSTQTPQLAYTSKVGDVPCFYIYNNGNAGFVIVGGDEAAQEILGYSENGAFDYDKAPENLKCWLSQYTDEISHAITEVKTGRAKITRKAVRKATAKEDIPNLVTAKWDQGAPYYDRIPLMPASWVGNNEDYQRLATGCVATAAAQVMYKWKYPEYGVGSNHYYVYYQQTDKDIEKNPYFWSNIENATTGDYSIYFSACFYDEPYEWDKMTDTYDENSSQDAKAAVAHLMYDVGVASKMTYGQLVNDGSGAFATNLGAALFNNFKYSKNINERHRSNYTDEEWEDLVYDELDNGRPILYLAGGVLDGKDTGAHEFIISGYQAEDNKFLLNWGWSGQYNGPFAISGTKALTPDGTGSGGAVAGSSYISNQSFLQNVQPDKGEEQSCYLYSEGFGLKTDKDAAMNLSVSAGTQVEMCPIDNVVNTGFVYNSGCTEVTADLGIRLVDTTDPTNVIDIDTEDQTFEINNGGYLSFTPYELGTYKVIPIYKDLDEWIEVRISTNINYPTVTVSAPTNGIAVSSSGFKSGTYATTDDKTLTAVIRNYEDKSTTRKFAAQLLKVTKNEDNELDYNPINALYLSDEVTIPANSEMTVSFPTLQLEENEQITISDDYGYAIAFADNTNTDAPVQISEYKTIEYCNTADINYTMTDAGWGTICLPFSADIPEGLTAYSVNDINATTGEITLDEVTETELKINTPYILRGTAGAYSFSGPDTPANTYSAGKLIGTTATGIYAPEGSYVLQNLNNVLAFYKVENENSEKLDQYHACIDSPTTTLATLTLPETTGINNINANINVSNTAAYNLAGQRVAPNTNGFVIINGKKTVNQ